MNPGSSQNYLIDVDAPDRASAEMLAHLNAEQKRRRRGASQQLGGFTR
jgi:hypothetical protein